MSCAACTIRRAAERVIYRSRLQAASDELVHRVANGSMPELVMPHVAREHKVSEDDLRSSYDERVYLRSAYLESVI